MIGELIYTSARAGLRSGTSGFCTVATSQGLSKRDQQALEALSGYEFAFGISDPRAASNPTCYLHTTLGSGATQHVLSRVGFAGADHTGRSNKIAHHLLLAGAGLPALGPAAAMRHLVSQQRWATTWDEPPRELEPWALPTPTSPTPRGDWGLRTGDQGWAGALARAFRSRPNAPAFVVFEPDTDVLALFEESLALLPPEERWDLCFSTYYPATLPPDRPCHWRGVLAGSPAADLCRRHAGATIIDLTKPLPAPEEDEFTRAARKGQVVSSPVSLVAPPKENKTSRKQRGVATVSAVEPELVLELRSVEEEASARGEWYQPGGDFAARLTEKRRTGLPAWCYFAAALLIGTAISIPAILAERVPPPPPQARTTRDRHVVAQPEPAIRLRPPIETERDPVVLDGHHSTSRANVSAIDSTALLPAADEAPVPSPLVASHPGASASSRPESVVRPLQLTTRGAVGEIEAIGYLSTATIVNPVAHPGAWAWTIPVAPETGNLTLVDGRIGKYVKLTSENGSLAVKSADLQTLGVLSATLHASEARIRFEPDPSHPEPEKRDAAIQALVLEVQSTPHPFLLPFRQPAEQRVIEVGYVHPGKTAQGLTLDLRLPPIMSVPNILQEAFPPPRVLLVRRGNLAACASLENRTLTLADVVLEVRSGEQTTAVEVESHRVRSLNRVSAWADSGDPLGAARSLASVQRNWIRAEQQLADAERALGDVNQGQGRGTKAYEEATSAVQRAEKDLASAKRDYDRQKKRLSAYLEWRTTLTHLESVLANTEVLVIDPWGLPIDHVQIHWKPGWTASLLTDERETTSR